MATKNAFDYPVSLSYNATALPWYTIFNRHKGIDYACPEGTPVRIKGKLVALSGNTGLTGGPHLHASKWVSLIKDYLGFPRFYKDPSDVEKTGGRIVYAGWFSTAGYAVIWKEIRLDGKRVFRMVCHLKKGSITVKRGDWIK